MIPTLDETLTLVRGLNDSTDRTAGVYIEVKSPHWHRAQGRYPSSRILSILARHGYLRRSDRKLVQLIGENDWLRTPAGLDAVARYADAIAPHLRQVLRPGTDGAVEVTPLAAVAHVDGVFTDFPDRTLELLTRFGRR